MKRPHEPADERGEDCGIEDIEDLGKLHEKACAAGEPSYIDPATGYSVFTADTLKKRGRCCGCGCRHCPYNHANVPMEKRAARIKAPALLYGSFAELKQGEMIDVLFWSGGKDSFLAARALRREHEGECGRMLFVTTFGAGSRTVAHQEVSIEQIVRQAATLRIPLLGIPLWPYTPYAERVAEAFGLIHAAGIDVGRVCSGDLHLEEVARWRMERIGPAVKELGAALYAPLWRVPYDKLLADLDASSTPCTVCAIGDHGPHGPLDIKIGEPFGCALLDKLPAHVDRFGENGEFHTLAEVWNASCEDPLA